MKNSILQLVQEDVIKYADVLSNVLQMDIEIVDVNLNRVAGTGIFKEKINENIMAEGYVYKYVIETGKRQIIENPGHHKLCNKCSKKGKCEETLELSSPIKLNDKVIGVIGLICSSEEDKIRLLKEEKNHILFLDQISDFITSKVKEYKEGERNKGIIDSLEKIIDSVDTGIIVISQEDKIVHINNAGCNELKLLSKYINSTIIIKSKNEFILGEEEYEVLIGNKCFNLLGSLIQLSTPLSSFKKVFIFNQMKKLKEIYNQNDSNNVITIEDIIGKSPSMISLKDKIKKIGSSNSTVLITGESGTGKELIARSIHSQSSRRDKPFISVNCPAIPETLLESELFGYVKGAFSGASINGRIGKFELANKGVIFLDEIGDMPLHFQVKILRIIQERKLVRVGSNKQIDLDIRIIAATNKDLKDLIKENKFREDLYYRLNVIPLEAPSLRDRKEDIILMTEMLIEKYNILLNKNVLGLDEELKNILINYPWQGNVRELQNTLEYMINIYEGKGILTKDMLPINFSYENKKSNNQIKIDSIMSLKEMENNLIHRALDIYGDDLEGKIKASEKLGIGIATLYRKLKEI